MAFITVKNPSSFLIFVAFFSLLVNFSSCFNPKLFNTSVIGAGVNGFSSGVATWYGPPTGAGSDGGACGFGSTVSQAPYYSFVSAGNSNDLFKGGRECGACYQVACYEHPACSGQPIKVTIMDECPGCGPNHFDLSGTAFGALAKLGQADSLRGAGELKIGFQRVACDYKGWKIAFHIDAGSNPFYLAFETEFENGDGDLGYVEVLPAGWREWVPMQLSWGSTWKVNLPNGGNGPFSIRLTTIESRRILVSKYVIPANWAPGQTYYGSGNF